MSELIHGSVDVKYYESPVKEYRCFACKTLLNFKFNNSEIKCPKCGMIATLNDGAVGVIFQDDFSKRKPILISREKLTGDRVRCLKR